MSNPFRATRLADGGTLSGSTCAERGLARRAVSARSDGEICLQISEPLRFHWARYAHLTHCLHGKCHLMAGLLSGLILIMLGYKAQCGAHISPEKWLCGLLSGWFIICMIRLALFTCLAAPRFVCYARGQLRISGLGTLRAGQILHWSIEHKVKVSACRRHGARLQICCRWLGCERHWTMLMEDGPETEELERLLEVQMPRNTLPTEQQLPRTIQIEAGVLSQ